MKKLGKPSRSNLIFSLVMLVVCGLLCLIPEAFTNPSSSIPRERVRIESVDNTQLYPLGIVYSGSQNCEVTVLTGEYAGESAIAATDSSIILQFSCKPDSITDTLNRWRMRSRRLTKTDRLSLSERDQLNSNRTVRIPTLMPGSPAHRRYGCAVHQTHKSIYLAMFLK